MKRRLVRTLTHLEWIFDTLVGRLRLPRAALPVIDLYLGYSTPEHWVAFSPGLSGPKAEWASVAGATSSRCCRCS